MISCFLLYMIVVSLRLFFLLMLEAVPLFDKGLRNRKMSFIL